MRVKNKNNKNKTTTKARSKRNSKRLRISPTDDCILSLEFVTHAMHSDDQVIRFQLVTQIANMGIDGALITFERNSMRGGEQLITRKKTPRLTHQRCHDLKFGGS